MATSKNETSALGSFEWVDTELTLPFRLGEWIIWRKRLRVRLCNYDSRWILSNQKGLDLQGDVTSLISENEHGIALFRSLPLKELPPRISHTRSHIFYMSEHYRRYFTDLSLGEDQYLATFSAKSRSTLRRKVRKFGDACGGTVDWREYKSPEELSEFHALARTISSRTYQENLLDAGLPSDDDFKARMLAAGQRDEIRAYLIFDGANQPLAYLYCPIANGVVYYNHLGYIAEHPLTKLSPGTILLWLALLHLQNDEQCHLFDFTEGDDRHGTGQKARFSTASVQCADLWVFRRTVYNRLLLTSHRFVDALSEWTGLVLEKMGVKHRVKQWLRTRSS